MPAPALVIVEQDQPYGEQGTRFSLEEVARRAGRGGLDARVRAWAIEQLERARIERGIACDTDRQRAEVLLRAVQKKLWVPDPVGAEWMAGAHLLACDRNTKDAVCMHGSDCDDLSLLLGACLLGVGIYVAIVGHAYGASRSISHVLIAAWVDGAWEYADPSTKLPLGTCVKFTRERLLSVPNVKVICDANVCLTEKTAYHPERTDFVVKGVFVGVDGPPVHSPIFAWTVPMQSLGQATKSTEQAASDAAQRELTKKGGSEEEKARAAAAAAAAVAATVACAELGPGAIACGAVAGAVADFITGAVFDLFGGKSCSPNCPPPVQFASMVDYYTKLKTKVLTPFTKKTYTTSETAAELKAMGAEEANTVWANQFGNTDVSTKYYAQIMGESAVLKAKQQVTLQARQLPGYIPPKKKSSPIVPLALVGAAAGGLWWLSR